MSDFIESSIVVGTAKKLVSRINNYMQHPCGSFKNIINHSTVRSMYTRLCKFSDKRPAAEYSFIINFILKVIYFVKRKLSKLVITTDKYFKESISGKFAHSFRQKPLSSFYIFAGTTFFVMSFIYIIMITVSMIAIRQDLDARLYVVPVICGLSGFVVSYWHKRFEAALQNSFVANIIRNFIYELIK